jgi:DNA-binding Lrp family transcriptional regulator
MPIILDAKDKKLLYELDCNSRQSLTMIGKKIKMSKENVHYRIKRLEKLEVIKGFYTLVNPLNIGYQYFRVGINYHNIDEETEERLINFLAAKDAVSWLGSHENFYDLVAVIIVRTINELYDLTKSISYNFQEFIEKIQVTAGLEVHYFKSNIIHGMNDSSFLTLRTDKSIIKIDEKDRVILKEISKNARISAVELGEKANLSAKNIIQRIRKLESNHLILGYLTNFNYQALGLHYLKILLYLIKPTHEIEKKIKNFLIFTQNLLYISDAIGLADMEFEVALSSHNDMYGYIRELRKAFPGQVKDFDSMVIHKVHKIKYIGEMIN